MELALTSNDKKLANMVFTSMLDRNDKQILSIRDQNVFDNTMRQKRLMTLMHLFIINRFECDTVHYLTPTEDNAKQCAGMLKIGLYDSYTEEGNMIIAANITDKVRAFVNMDSGISNLIYKEPTGQLVEA